jgi:hypothetical protein
MREVEFAVPKNCDLRKADKLVEEICARRGLQLAMKGTVATYPGSIHWHYKQPKQKGTLELTLYFAERRLWAKIQKGRKAPWIDEELPALRRAIESALRALDPRPSASV